MMTTGANFEDELDLYKRNGMLARDGRVCGVLAPPPLHSQVFALQIALRPLVTDAENQGVMLRVGVLAHRPGPDQPEHLALLVYAVDLGGTYDEHDVLRRLAQALLDHGVQPLDEDLSPDEILDLTNDLLAQPKTL